MTNVNPSTLARVQQSPSFIRKRNLPTPPPSLSDVNDSSSCSSSTSSSSSSSPNDSQSSASSVNSCDLLNILTDDRFRPVFQAIEEIKRRKCRPDLDRILKYVEKRSLPYQREEIIVMLDDLLKYGLITKVFHKGGFTIRIKNDKYGRLIENINQCSNRKTSNSLNNSNNGLSTNSEMSWPSPLPTSSILNTKDNEIENHQRETPSPEFAGKTKGEKPFSPFVKRQRIRLSFENKKDSSPTFDESKKSFQTSPSIQLKRQRNRTSSSSSSSSKKKSRPTTITTEFSDPNKLSLTTSEPIFRKPFLNQDNHLPPVTIEQLLGLRGDIPDVHHWTTNDLIQFFHQQGYDYASIVLIQNQINGNQLYELKREEVFRMSTLKIGKSLKLWNVIEQIQRNYQSSSSCTK